MKFINAIRKFIAGTISLITLATGAIVAVPFLVLIIIADWINPTEKSISKEELSKRMNKLSTELQKVMK